MNNIMSCQGFSNPGFMGDCSLAWLAIAVLVFLVLIEKKQLGENAGTGYNIFAGFGGALLPALIIISFFGSAKWALIGGVIGSLLGGVGIGQIADTTEGE